MIESARSRLTDFGAAGLKKAWPAVRPVTRFSRLTTANGAPSVEKRGHSRQNCPIGI